MTAVSRLGLTASVFRCCLQRNVRYISDVPYQRRKIDIVTCRHLFPKHKDKGLDFEVTYIDEKPHGADDSGRLPVVLMLHGSPGSYEDFHSQIDCLTRRGTRVVVPNFPDLTTIRKYRFPAFRNTPLNKSALIRDFLKALGISKIDMLVTHSSGTYTGLRLYRSQEDPDVDAFAMINPAGHWHTLTNPRWFYQPLGELVHWRLGYALFRIIGMKLFPLLGPVDVPNIDEPLLSLTAIRSFNLKEVAEGLKEVESRRPPLLFTFSENDRLIGRKVSYDMLKVLGCDRKDWWFYDDKGDLKTKGREDDWLKAISFQAGSHYSFKKHPDVINSALLELFERLPIARTVGPVAESPRTVEQYSPRKPLEQREPVRPQEPVRSGDPIRSGEPVLVPRLVTARPSKHDGEIFQEVQKVRL